MMIPMIVRTIPVTTRKTPMVIALQACHRHPVVILIWMIMMKIMIMTMKMLMTIMMIQPATTHGKGCF